MRLTICIFLGIQILYQYLLVTAKLEHSKENTRSLLENMDNILKETLFESRCCHIYINPDATFEEYKLFDTLLSLYQETYFLSKQTYDCADHIIIASHDYEIENFLKSIPVDISFTRILILLKSNLDIESNALNTFDYGNSHVYIKSSDGLLLLSENYIEPRVFYKVSRFKNVETRERIVDLMGRNLQVATYYNPPFSFLKTSVKEVINGVPAEIFLTENKQELDGIELQLFLIIAKALNFTYTIRKPTGGYNHGRKFNASFWNGGMIAQVVNKEVDLAFGDIWMNLDTYNFVNLSEPWSQVSIKFLVPRPKALSSLWGLVRPLSASVWLLLAIVVCAESLCIRYKANLDPLVPEYYRNLGHDLLDLLARILGCTLVSAPPSQLRPHLVLWQLAGVIIITFYSSSLSATLTYPDYEDRIDTIEDFIENNLTWGRENVHPQFDLYFNMKDPVAKLMPSRFVLEMSADDRMRRILAGNYAVVGRVVGHVYFPEGTVYNHTMQMLRVMKEPAGKFYASFAVQPWLLNPVNTVMSRLKESGIIQYHLENVLHRRAGSYLRSVFIEHDTIDPDRVMTLTMNSLSPAFAVLIFGILVASSAFYLELQSDYREQNTPLHAMTSSVFERKLAFIHIHYVE
ncbi:hypothetical protein QAD02_022986 [Eretmocerus hayati]|uniref:Uncharacterized protein n=1 Tax=Eretmocerus hayati TaxID=131215 RepID=A0ACC2PXX7_9HYME|nr:hypothetical protein QAD02_022986 [Eretmocerus hayati]